VVVLAALINFGTRKLLRRNIALVDTPMKAAEMFVASGGGILVHDALVDRKYL